MAVHPFGAVSSPFVANFALRQSVSVCDPSVMQLVVNAVQNNFYVDDLLISVSTEDEATEFICQIREVLSRCGFLLRKWLSNVRCVLSEVPSEDLAHPNDTCNFSSLPMERTLGLDWNSTEELFRFSFRLDNKPFSRRGVLSVVPSIFDPLGMVGPLLLPAKLLLQKLCRDKLDWDAELSSADRKIWQDWIRRMEKLSSLKIPRCIKRREVHVGNPQMHVFCDASESGYGAVVYARFSVASSLPYCSLLFAKSRVAPLKTVTIPRLELAAAKLAITLSCVVKGEMKLEFESVFFWTDSTIVLHYINNTSARFSTFVANRLAVIHQFSKPCQWRHVGSEINPADLASRGIHNISQLRYWLNGPVFLTQDQSTWPRTNLQTNVPEEVELKRTHANVNTIQESSVLYRLITYYSCWTRLLKAVTWLTRFKQHIMKRDRKHEPHFSVEELRHAEKDVTCLVQAESFPDIWRSLSSNKIPGALKSSGLQKLCPILIDGLICVGGRLDYSENPEESKHPVILPKKHAATDLIIKHYHEKEGRLIRH